MNVMEVNEEAVLERLRVEDPEFRKWEEEHKELEHKLRSIDSHPHLTSEEEIERKRIQKLKLLAKDRMVELIRRYKLGNA